MLDNKLLRDDAQDVAARLKVKGFDFPLARYQALEDERRELQTRTESLQNERKTRSKAIGKAKAAGEDVADIMAGIDTINSQLDDAKHAFAALQAELASLLEGIPNLPDASVPAGRDEDSNVEIKRWRDPADFNFEPKDHVDLTAAGGLDFEAGTKLTGSRFVVMNGAVAKLQRALTQFMLDLHTGQHGYQEVYVPYIVNAESLRGTGQLPKMEEDLFKLQGDQGYYLAPTAEVPVTNLLRGEIVDEALLPLR
ncbi:MAG: serine--tRNA ligase, partial [Pseudomonadales bacterium]